MGKIKRKADFQIFLKACHHYHPSTDVAAIERSILPFIGSNAKTATAALRCIVGKDEKPTIFMNLSHYDLDVDSWTNPPVWASDEDLAQINSYPDFTLEDASLFSKS